MTARKVHLQLARQATDAALPRRCQAAGAAADTWQLHALFTNGLTCIRFTRLVSNSHAPPPQVRPLLARRASGAAPCRCQAASAAADYRQRAPQDVRVLVVGATGYIGKYVVKELVKRGYDVVALARERSGIGGKASREDVQRVLSPACTPGQCGRW